MKNTNPCFGRVSEKTLSECNSIEDLVNSLNTTTDGRKINIVGDIDTFKSTLESFKEYLEKELPDFSSEEILKFDMQFHKLKKIYEWHNAHYLLTALEFELRKK